MISAWCDDIVRPRRGPSTTEVVEHFEMLIDIEQMRKALDGVKLSLKIREKEERENEIKGEVGPPPTNVLARLNGISAEKIAELEKEYEATTRIPVGCSLLCFNVALFYCEN